MIESGVLKGLNLEDIKRAGELLILQDGCNNFFQSIIQNEQLNADIHVLSYCWCGDLMRSAFSSGISLLIRTLKNGFSRKIWPLIMFWFYKLSLLLRYHHLYDAYSSFVFLKLVLFVTSNVQWVPLSVFKLMVVILFLPCVEQEVWIF